jgi:hypothetical protein
MEKKLQDYIQYYIGCKCTNEWFPKGHNMHSYNWELKGIRYDGSVRPYLLVNEEQDEFTWTDSIKPILRQVNSLIDSEKLFLYNLFPTQDNLTDSHKIDSVTHWLEEEGADKYFWAIVQFDWLIKQGFDLFSLISNGLAIDASTLTK